MRDFKTLGIRVNEREARAIQTLANHEGITVSELVRRWILIALLDQTKTTPLHTVKVS